MLVQVFLLSLAISFLATIPPATINITAMQLSLKGRAITAYALSLGAAILDTFYGALAVNIQLYLSEQLEFTNYFFLIAALVLLVLGVASLLTKVSSKEVKVKDTRGSGFLKGVVLGALNPLAMPFWLGVTAYLQVQGLIELDGANYWAYVAGVFVGEIGMLIIIVKVGSKFTRVADNRMIVNVIPGIAFILLAIFNFVQWLGYYL